MRLAPAGAPWRWRRPGRSPTRSVDAELAVIRTSGDEGGPAAAASGDKSRFVRGDRAGAARRATSGSPCTAPRTSPASCRTVLSFLASPPREDPAGRLDRARRVDHPRDARRCPGRNRGAPPPFPSSSPLRPISTWSRSAATSTRGSVKLAAGEVDGPRPRRRRPAPARPRDRDRSSGSGCAR